MENELDLRPLSELEGMVFTLPYLQRGYRWRPANVIALLEDLRAFIGSGKNLYCLQPLAVVDQGDKKYEVLDGQQRLITLYLLYQALGVPSPYTLEFMRDKRPKDEDSRGRFLLDIESYQEVAEVDDSIDHYFIHKAYKTIVEFFQKDQEQKEHFCELLEAGRDEPSVQFLWYEVDKELRHETFRCLNSGKIPLTNTELIKAQLLNRVSGVPQKEIQSVAFQFEEMERMLRNDHFWYMFNSQELPRGYSRMDVLFNHVAGVSQVDYQLDPRHAFHSCFANLSGEHLLEKWQEVRTLFLRLKDLFNNPYTYHYIGFLAFHANGVALKELEGHLKSVSKEELIAKLQRKIQEILTAKHASVADYRYGDSSTGALRDLFVMHNVETILQRYEKLREDKQLRYSFERFPFELLHRQKWDIEHIAPSRDNQLTSLEEWNEWVKGVEEDEWELFGPNGPEKIKEARTAYENMKTKKNFQTLYELVIDKIDERQDAIKEEEKNQIGNLTLLDSTTNRSYHNALFPKKRRTVIVAEAFVPPCTQAIFTKSYSRAPGTSLGRWTQTDADAYQEDMAEKLKIYFPSQKDNQ